MKSVLSLTLIVCLLESALPLTAQEQTERTGPLAKAVTREAVRLATAGETTSSTAAAVQLGGKSARSDWARVVTITSDTDVVVTVRGSKPARCTFVQADESALIVRTGRWQVVQTIARGDVQEIRTGPSGRRRALGLLGGLGGAIGGAYVGVKVGSAGSDAEDLRGSSLGGMAGLVGGAVLGYRAVTRTKGDLIYSAP